MDGLIIMIDLHLYDAILSLVPRTQYTEHPAFQTACFVSYVKYIC